MSIRQLQHAQVFILLLSRTPHTRISDLFLLHCCSFLRLLACSYDERLFYMTISIYFSFGIGYFVAVWRFFIAVVFPRRLWINLSLVFISQLPVSMGLIHPAHGLQTPLLFFLGLCNDAVYTGLEGCIPGCYPFLFLISLCFLPFGNWDRVFGLLG